MKNLDYPPVFFEKKAWNNNLYVCGIDEVGRGCLAGPVVTAAAIIPINTFSKLLQDSKKLNPNQRSDSFEWIKQNCFYSTATASHKTIDKINIYQATLYAMKKAYTQLIETMPIELEQIKYVLIDAMPLKLPTSYKHKNLEIINFNYGETISPTIAAASIAAKVRRDKIMSKIDPIFPSYKLKKHKGYGTQTHTESIVKQGLSIIHRTSFTTKLNKEEQNGNQKSLF